MDENKIADSQNDGGTIGRTDLIKEVLRKLNNGELIELKEKSGLDETLKLGMNDATPSDNDRETISRLYKQTPTKKLSFNIYAEGNGIVFEKGKLGLVGHRDILIAQTPEGELVAHTDYKTHNYDPMNNVDSGRVDTESLPARFLNIRGGSNSIERIHLDTHVTDNLSTLMEQRGFAKEADIIKQTSINQGDPYKKGVGHIMQATAVAYLSENNISQIQRNIHYSESANKLWSEYGVEIDEKNKGVLETKSAYLKSNKVLSESLRKEQFEEYQPSTPHIATTGSIPTAPASPPPPVPPPPTPPPPPPQKPSSRGPSQTTGVVNTAINKVAYQVGEYSPEQQQFIKDHYGLDANRSSLLATRSQVEARVPAFEVSCCLVVPEQNSFYDLTGLVLEVSPEDVPWVVDGDAGTPTTANRANTKLEKLTTGDYLRKKKHQGKYAETVINFKDDASDKIRAIYDFRVVPPKPNRVQHLFRPVRSKEIETERSYVLYKREQWEKLANELNVPFLTALPDTSLVERVRKDVEESQKNYQKYLSIIENEAPTLSEGSPQSLPLPGNEPEMEPAPHILTTGSIPTAPASPPPPAPPPPAPPASPPPSRPEGPQITSGLGQTMSRVWNTVKTGVQTGAKALGSAIGNLIAPGVGGAIGKFVGSEAGQAITDPAGFLKKWGGRMLIALKRIAALLATIMIALIAEILVGIVAFVFLVIIILFIINSGAYVVPQGGFAPTSSPGPLPAECPSGWPILPEGTETNLDVIQGPQGTFSHSYIEAIDVPATVGHTITARHAGIAHINPDPNQSVYYGCYVDIESTCNGVNFVSRYAHLDDIYIADGRGVYAGDQVGISGGNPLNPPPGCGAGHTTGAHLHYEFRNFTAGGGGKTCPSYPPPCMEYNFIPKTVPRGCSSVASCNTSIP